MTEHILEPSCSFFPRSTLILHSLTFLRQLKPALFIRWGHFLWLFFSLSEAGLGYGRDWPVQVFFVLIDKLLDKTRLASRLLRNRATENSKGNHRFVFDLTVIAVWRRIIVRTGAAVTNRYERLVPASTPNIFDWLGIQLGQRHSVAYFSQWSDWGCEAFNSEIYRWGRPWLLFLLHRRLIKRFNLFLILCYDFVDCTPAVSHYFVQRILIIVRLPLLLVNFTLEECIESCSQFQTFLTQWCLNQTLILHAFNSLQ